MLAKASLVQRGVTSMTTLYTTWLWYIKYVRANIDNS